jgi:hypothetical protein
MKKIENPIEFIRNRFEGRQVSIHTVGAPGKDLGIRPGVLLFAAALAIGASIAPAHAQAVGGLKLSPEMAARAAAIDASQDSAGCNTIGNKHSCTNAPIYMGRHENNNVVVLGNVTTIGDGAVTVIGNQAYFDDAKQTDHSLEDLQAEVHARMHEANAWAKRR